MQQMQLHTHTHSPEVTRQLLKRENVHAANANAHTNKHTHSPEVAKRLLKQENVHAATCTHTHTHTHKHTHKNSPGFFALPPGVIAKRSSQRPPECLRPWLHGLLSLTRSGPVQHMITKDALFGTKNLWPWLHSLLSFDTIWACAANKHKCCCVFPVSWTFGCGCAALLAGHEPRSVSTTVPVFEQ
jgi:hypothetical protein